MAEEDDLLERAQLLQKAKQVQAQAVPQQGEAPGLLSQGIDAAARGMDYLGGINRAGIVTIGDLKAMKHDPSHKFTVTGEDVGNILQGKGPSSSQYLERMGVSPGPTANLPIVGKTSLRDAEGLALDIGTDPVTSIARGAKGLARKLINPAGELAEKTGEKMYKSGFKKIDERLAEKGKKPISDVLLENGAPTGTTKKIAEDADALSKGLLEERQGLYAKAGDAGTSVDLGHPLPNAEKELKALRSKPTKKAQAMADDLEEMMNDYKKQGKVGIDKLSEWKTDLYDDLPESAFAGGRLKRPAAKFQKALARDFKEAIENAGNFTEPGLGDRVQAINENLGSLLTSQKPMAIQVRRGETPNLVTSVDAILSGHPGLLAAKKTADAAKTTYLRTKAGKGLIKAGRSGNAQGLLNRGIINSEREDGQN